jgi:hypothetical protein
MRTRAMRRGNARRIGTEGAPKRRRVAQAGAGRSIHVVCVGPYSVVFFDFCVHGVFVLVPAVVVNVRCVMPGMTSRFAARRESNSCC